VIVTWPEVTPSLAGTVTDTLPSALVAVKPLGVMGGGVVVDGLDGELLLPPPQPIAAAPEARLTTSKTTPRSLFGLNRFLIGSLNSRSIRFSPAALLKPVVGFFLVRVVEGEEEAQARGYGSDGHQDVTERLRSAAHSD
jgi:hypothetical protein